MKALLDTHALIWFLTDHPHLSKNARELIEGDERPIYLSSVVVAEISIKYARGKLQLPLAPRELVPKLLYDMRLTSLDFTLRTQAGSRNFRIITAIPSIACS